MATFLLSSVSDTVCRRTERTEVSADPAGMWFLMLPIEGNMLYSIT